MRTSSERSASESWSKAHAQAVGQLNTRVGDTYGAAKNRLIVAKEDIKVVSAAVLDSVCVGEPTASSCFAVMLIARAFLCRPSAYCSGTHLRQTLLGFARAHRRSAAIQCILHR